MGSAEMVLFVLPTGVSDNSFTLRYGPGCWVPRSSPSGQDGRVVLNQDGTVVFGTKTWC